MKRNPLHSVMLASMGIDVLRKESGPRRAVLRRGPQAPLPAALAIILPGKNSQRLPVETEVDLLLLAFVVIFYLYLGYLLVRAEVARSKLPDTKDGTHES